VAQVLRHAALATVLVDLLTPEEDRVDRRTAELRFDIGLLADRLAGATDDPGLDGWLVPEPWPDIVDIRRGTKALEPLFASGRQPLARSPLTLVVWKDRAAALGSRCPGGVSWKCLGDAAAAGPWTASGGRGEWGPIKPGHPDPDEGSGLPILGQAVADWFGRIDLSTIDLDDERFQQWLTGLERAVPTSPSAGSALAQMLATGRAVYDLVATVEAEARPLVDRAAVRTEVSLIYPAPMATADVVLATMGGDQGRRLRDAAGGDASRRALAEAGWRVPGQPRPAAEPPLPPGPGLPSPGFLDALRSRAIEARRR
jgi:hypothetical protein